MSIDQGEVKLNMETFTTFIDLNQFCLYFYFGVTYIFVFIIYEFKYLTRRIRLEEKNSLNFPISYESSWWDPSMAVSVNSSSNCLLISICRTPRQMVQMNKKTQRWRVRKAPIVVHFSLESTRSTRSVSVARVFSRHNFFIGEGDLRNP